AKGAVNREHWGERDVHRHVNLWNGAPLSLGSSSVFLAAPGWRMAPIHLGHSRDQRSALAPSGPHHISFHFSVLRLYRELRALRDLWCAVAEKLDLLGSLVICAVASAGFSLLTATFTLWAESRVSAQHDGFTWQQVLSNAPGAAFVLIAWAAVYFGVQHYKLSEYERARATEAERLAREAQFKALRYQLQPHFLFNTLNAISSLVVMENGHGATEMIARLADLLRSSLDAPETHFVPLCEEVRVANHYLAIESIRFRDRLQVCFDLNPDTLEIPVPRFLLQPLLENAIRHGISHLRYPGTIRLASATQDSLLLISILNDCDPVYISRQGNTSGVGLENTRRRMDETYGVRGKLEAMLQPDGKFSVKLGFPCDSHAGVFRVS
ncbi:MAG: histidine kinase, partial [Acidobacteriota bacterium]|nr:histidine kinase [Acidobacteriota bacterium]